MNSEADFGLIGLAVMGQNLVMNINDHGWKVVVFNRTTSKVDDFLAGPAKGSNVIGTHDLKEFFEKLKRPRKCMLMVKAGNPVDQLIEECLPFLEEGDILIDGGNSHYPDSQRRCRELAKKGILFVGTGISGGEEGARYGPSIMPGGNPKAWPLIKDLFQTISAKAEEDGLPCCDWVGEDGAGHYVKMVHNGIEYGDMQLICEAFSLLHDGVGLDYPKIQEVFGKWNQGELKSYLIEITSTILGHKEDDGSFTLDKILDVAGQKGTGKWTGISALDIGQPLTLIGEAVFARCLSSLKEDRLKASKLYPRPSPTLEGDKESLVETIKNGLYAAKIISYAQGFMLMRAAAKEFGWKLDYGSIALMWRAGCIIRSRFLNDIKAAYEKDASLENLLFDPFFQKEIQRCEQDLRKLVSLASQNSIPIPSLSSALAFFDGYRSSNLPANLLQAQRDFFGAHTYERVDQERGKFFHTNWTGSGGDITSSSYNV